MFGTISFVAKVLQDFFTPLLGYCVYVGCRDRLETELQIHSSIVGPGYFSAFEGLSF